MNLRIEKGDEVGVMKDETGVVRGLWFRDRESAENPARLSATAAMLTATGERIEESDRFALSAAALAEVMLKVEVAQGIGGYVVRFPSALGIPGGPTAMQLHMERTDWVGIIKDEAGTLRGLCYPSHQLATDLEASKRMIAMLRDEQLAVEDADVQAISSGECEPRLSEDLGGVLLLFPSAMRALSGDENANIKVEPVKVEVGRYRDSLAWARLKTNAKAALYGLFSIPLGGFIGWKAFHLVSKLNTEVLAEINGWGRTLLQVGIMGVVVPLFVLILFWLILAPLMIVVDITEPERLVCGMFVANRHLPSKEGPFQCVCCGRTHLLTLSIDNPVGEPGSLLSRTVDPGLRFILRKLAHPGWPRFRSATTR